MEEDKEDGMGKLDDDIQEIVYQTFISLLKAEHEDESGDKFLHTMQCAVAAQESRDAE